MSRSRLPFNVFPKLTKAGPHGKPRKPDTPPEISEWDEEERERPAEAGQQETPRPTPPAPKEKIKHPRCDHCGCYLVKSNSRYAHCHQCGGIQHIG